VPGDKHRETANCDRLCCGPPSWSLVLVHCMDAAHHRHLEAQCLLGVCAPYHMNLLSMRTDCQRIKKPSFSKIWHVMVCVYSILRYDLHLDRWSHAYEGVHKWYAVDVHPTRNAVMGFFVGFFATVSGFLVSRSRRTRRAGLSRLGISLAECHHRS
jgi:hypothetical protein